jgi:hypothetical protein
MPTSQFFTKDRKTVLDDLKRLGQEETLILKIMVDDNSEKTKQHLVSIIPDFTYERIYKLAENNADFNLLCETHPGLDRFWEAELKKEKHPSEVIESMDNKQTPPCSRFSRIKAAFLLTRLGDIEKMDVSGFALLHKACDYGLYKALVQRLTLFARKINNSDPEDNNVKSAIIYAKKDAVTLSNLYWSVGMVNAGNALLNVANNCYQLKIQQPAIKTFQDNVKNNFNQWRWSEKYNDKSLPDYVQVLHLAFKSFYKAKLLADFPMSKELIKEIYPEKGLLTETEFTDWKEAEKYMVEFATSLEVPIPESFCTQALRQAEREVEEIQATHEVAHRP